MTYRRMGERLGVGAIWAAAFGVLLGTTLADEPRVAAEGGVEQEELLPVAYAASFAGDIMPILEARCTECHGEVDASGEEVLEEGLNLTTYEGLMAGSTWGTVVEAGDADASLLLEMIVNGDMPKDAEEFMPAEEIELIRAWIAEGALNN